MDDSIRYAPPPVWDGYYESKLRNDDDLNPEGLWANAWLPLIAPHAGERLLDLGCGTGGDSLVLARAGYLVTGLDYSAAAVSRGRVKAEEAGLEVRFIQWDMAERLPFDEDAFDLIMSNVALHMFDDATTRGIVAECGRSLRTNGIFCLHVNSTEDMPYRALRYPRERELAPDFWLEAHGQTMHFFDEGYLRDVLSGWRVIHLEHRALIDTETEEVFKCVWQCIARKEPVDS